MAETTVISSTGKRFYFLLKYFQSKTASSFVAIMYEWVCIFRAKWLVYRNGLLAVNQVFSTNFNYFISLSCSFCLTYHKVGLRPLRYLHGTCGSNRALDASWAGLLWFLELIFKSHTSGRTGLPTLKINKTIPMVEQNLTEALSTLFFPFLFASDPLYWQNTLFVLIQNKVFQKKYMYHFVQIREFICCASSVSLLRFRRLYLWPWVKNSSHLLADYITCQPLCRDLLRYFLQVIVTMMWPSQLVSSLQVGKWIWECNCLGLHTSSDKIKAWIYVLYNPERVFLTLPFVTWPDFSRYLAFKETESEGGDGYFYGSR